VAPSRQNAKTSPHVIDDEHRPEEFLVTQSEVSSRSRDVFFGHRAWSCPATGARTTTLFLSLFDRAWMFLSVGAYAVHESIACNHYRKIVQI